MSVGRGPFENPWACHDSRVNGETGLKRIVEGEDRRQTAMLTPSIDDFGSEESLVRNMVASEVGTDLAVLGFSSVAPKRTSRGAHTPATLLKVVVHIYLSRNPTIRRREREADPDQQFRWLTATMR